MINLVSAKNRNYHLFCLIVTLLAFTSCGILKASVPVGTYGKELPKVPPPDAVAALVPEGYQVEVFMKDLIWPTSIAFDDDGNVYVAEAGYVYGDLVAPTSIFKVSQNGKLTSRFYHFIYLNQQSFFEAFAHVPDAFLKFPMPVEAVVSTPYSEIEVLKILPLL